MLLGIVTWKYNIILAHANISRRKKESGGMVDQASNRLPISSQYISCSATFTVPPHARHGLLAAQLLN